MPDVTTGPPLNLILPTVGGDIDAWGPLLITNFEAINAFAASLGALQVAPLIGTPDGSTVVSFVSPFNLADAQGKSYAVIYNGSIVVCGNIPSANGIYYTVSGPNNTVITFSFFPEVNADLRILVI